MLKGLCLFLLRSFLAFSPLSPLVLADGCWEVGDRRGFPGTLEAEAGEHMGILPLQLRGMGVRNQGRLFLGFGASQALEKLPGPCVWAHHREPPQCGVCCWEGRRVAAGWR